MSYNFNEIEKKWQTKWQEEKLFSVEVDQNKPKFYVLDMFPYPSGAGLHVGHPLGYIASDIYSRYKRLKGFNVLHPMGYDAFGLPAEQYAIQTGQHPATTTEKNINRYREQMDRLGFSFDWDREVRTCDPDYYHWTQWMFLELFKHWFNNKTQKAETIDSLITLIEKEGNKNIEATCNAKTPEISADDWAKMTEEEKQNFLQNYRLAYQDETFVNWCPKLGTVLANDEVKEGLSVRGGHPVEQKKMKQWLLRVSAYSQRLLDGLDTIDWTESLKEIQRNWIGRSEGATVFFPIENHIERLEIFTTRPDTLFGVSFMVLAPEHEWVEKITTPEQKKVVEDYIFQTKKKTERDRISDVKNVTGAFTGAYCLHPFTGKQIPIWIGDYVLSGYGTGAIMAVPGHDQRDYDFAKQFNLPIIEVVAGGNLEEEAYAAKDGTLINSDFMNGLRVPEAIKKTNEELEKQQKGSPKVNFRLRDAIFSRQRYWGEPIPIYYKNGIPYPLPEDQLPLELPNVNSYLPTEEGEAPLGRAKDWKHSSEEHYELTTMPGFAGSSAYYLRYMDAKNKTELVSKEKNEYWENVDLYVGGSEHAVGHLIYSRFFNKFLFDIGKVCKDEPFKKLINQGMIQGRSNFVYRKKGTNTFVSYNLKKDHDVTPIHVDVNIVHNDHLDLEAFKNWREEYKDAQFILEEDGHYLCGNTIEKMSKSLFNVVNPDKIVEDYGADTLRLYEMFLGPIEQSKPWNTSGIEGVSRFLHKVWRFCFDESNQLTLTDEEPSPTELKILHTAIKKVEEAIETFSLNIGVSSLMICLNDLTKENCKKKSIMRPFLTLLSSFAPHLSEEIWQRLGEKESVCFSTFPSWEQKYLVENTYTYPISINGKKKFLKEISLDLNKEEIEKVALEDEKTQSFLQGKQIKKIIVVPKRIVNIVI
ncbi:MAG: leucine--tRNA ligase [Bdellovibrionota bacterium]|nr:leucine--tRNA ligase [Bdellovibrionota bacterium]